MRNSPFPESFRTLSITTASERDTECLGQYLGQRLQCGDVIALIGSLGAGKTVFTRGLVTGVDPEADVLVVSPSFTIVHQYETKIPINHIDLFRLADDDDFLVEFDDYMTDDAITVIEWADRTTLSTRATWFVRFDWHPDDRRTIVISRGHADSMKQQ